MKANAVTLKLPEFWEQQAWFAQAEAQFALRDITEDDTKYSTASRAVSLLNEPPERDKYGALKMYLLGTFGLTESERARQLLSLPGLGDAKPSELNDHMLTLLGEHKPCFIFKELFLQQMTEQVHMVWPAR